MMDKWVKITLYSVLFILAFAIITGVYRGYQKKKAGNQQNELVLDSDKDEKGFFDSSDDTTAAETESNVNGAEEQQQEDGLFKQADIDFEETPKPTYNEPNDSPSSRNENYSAQTKKSSGSGRYFVLAGNFLVETNADRMVSNLREKGFQKSEVVVFDASRFYTVSAGRYSDYNEAQREATRLKQVGVDCYVHEQKY